MFKGALQYQRTSKNNPKNENISLKNIKNIF